MQTKIDLVKKHLIKYGSISPREAIEKYNYYRLADGIMKLKRRGMDIESEMIYLKNSRYALYKFKG
jgi:hypothetical protein